MRQSFAPETVQHYSSESLWRLPGLNQSLKKTEEAAWMSSKMFWPNKTDVQLPRLNFEVI